MDNRVGTVRIASLIIGLAVAAGALAADQPAILSEGGTAGFWRPAPGSSRAVPDYPASLVDQSEDVCVSLGYLLKPDGSTSDFALLTSWGSKTPDPIQAAAAGHFDAFTKSAAAAVSQWKFVPAERGYSNLAPMYTAVTFAFSTNPATDRTQLRARCVIADLPEFVAKAQARR